MKLLAGMFVVFAISTAGCSKGPPALRDGLYLEYTIGESLSCRIEFQKMEDDSFTAILEPSDCSMRPEGYSIGEPIVVNAYLKAPDIPNLMWGEFALLWLPEKHRKAGTHLSVGGSFQITEIKHWEDWDVAVVNAQIGALKGIWYYDLATGFIVGMEKSFVGETNRILLLQDTNT